jgi:disulfide bond formation protein DsbB
MGEGVRAARLLAFATSALLLGGAYLGQYAFGLYPCEMCWWQRYSHFVALGLAIVAFVLPSARWAVALAGVAIAVSGAIGAFHAGVEYGWWKGLTACSTTRSAGADALTAILDAPVIRCDIAPWSLFGVSLAGWNFLFSSAAALAIAILLTAQRKPAP